MRSTWALVSVPIAVTRANTHCYTSKTALLFYLQYPLPSRPQWGLATTSTCLSSLILSPQVRCFRHGRSPPMPMPAES
ncbi:hypothetical protein IWX49DRAFT_88182 [Phyllosticta citricarpa]